MYDAILLSICTFIVGLLVGSIQTRNHGNQLIKNAQDGWEKALNQFEAEVKNHQKTLEAWQKSIRKDGAPV